MAWGMARISVKAYEYLTEGEIKTEEDERIPCNLHFEYVGKSVKEEEQQYLAALLTILGHVPGGIGAIAGMLSIGMTVYDGIKENLCEEENVSSIVSIFNSEATVEYKKAREAYPKDLKEFNKKHKNKKSRIIFICIKKLLGSTNRYKSNSYK